jgi:cell division protein ZapA
MCVSVRVQILGEEHLIKGDASAEYIKKLAHEVDTHLRKVQHNNPTLPRHKVAILAALNLADELEKLRLEHNELLKLMEEAN